MKLALNREYARRHLFAMVVLLGIGGWFGFDGFVRYPKMTGAELYREIEKSDPPAGMDLEEFKRQKTQSQYWFAIFGLVAAGVVGLRLFRASRFSCEFDETGYTVNGERREFSEVKNVDRSRWEKKGILKVDGVTFDSWHHVGVGELAKRLDVASEE